ISNTMSTTHLSTLSLHDALPIFHGDINPSNVLVHHGTPFYIDWQVARCSSLYLDLPHHFCTLRQAEHYRQALAAQGHEISRDRRSEEHTSELQSRGHLVCRLLLE